MALCHITQDSHALAPQAQEYRGQEYRGQVMLMLSVLSLYFLKGAEYAAQTPYRTTR